LSKPTTLRFYFDYISSNAYLAWVELPRLEQTYGVGVEPIPTPFAGLLEAHGQLGSAEMPAKTRWMWRNKLRKAALLGVPSMESATSSSGATTTSPTWRSVSRGADPLDPHAAARWERRPRPLRDEGAFETACSC
jgi:2-hydroxychromene-2-carboxylate isomerase